MNSTDILRIFATIPEDKPTPQLDRLIAGGYYQRAGGYIRKAKSLGLKTPPSQRWHLLDSWAGRPGGPFSFDKRITCGELVLFVAESLDAVTPAELDKLVSNVLVSPSNRRSGNRKISTICFKPIMYELEKRLALLS